ncbi:MAG: hypothetical protein INR70_29765 [Parafilimonas terrae]|nr:hypothetical protein [Parafilimonas terrae]
MPTPGDVARSLAVFALVVGSYAAVHYYVEGILDGRICPRCLRRTFRGDHERCKPRDGRGKPKPPTDPGR